MNVLSLNGKWQLRGKREGSNDDLISLLATVPGCCALDLAHAGYLPEDLFMGMNVTEAEKYEDYEWWYERRFEYNGGSNAFIVFDGVDCIAEYYINGIFIGKSDNMLISHEFPIDGALIKGENTVTVHISSPTVAATRYDYPISLINNWNIDSRYIRRPPHSWGWDIMPRTVTAGIWRDVRIEERDRIYFTQSFMYAIPGKCTYYYTLATDGHKLEGVEIEVSAACADSCFTVREICDKPFGRINIRIPKPKLWYPYGYGEPNVYDGTVRIYSCGELVHEEAISFGIRSVNLERRAHTETVAGDFRITVNGIDVMCRGSNWVPLDAYHSRDKERYDEALALVSDIGCNILRCWGGNVYEADEFYDYCDRNGIMVWQDFAMACARYPQNEDFKVRLREEATAVIRRLRNHPSLIIWAGDNEVDQLNSFDPDTNVLTREVLPECVRENDIGRPYLPSSPYITADEKRRELPLIENHLWGPRDYFKSDFYKNNTAAFISETGYHGCPSLESIKRFISPDRVWPYHNNPEWILHSSDQNGNDARVMLMEKQVRQLFGEVPDDIERYIMASQISQAEAKKYFIERVRVDRPKKTGIIWWNLLDGWPQMSDAVVDYYFTKKLAYYYIKRSQAPFVIAAGELENWELPIYACNDTMNEVRGNVKITDADSGKVMLECAFTAAANATARIGNIPVYYSDKGALIIEWECGTVRGFNHYILGYPPISLDWYIALIERYGLDK